MKSNQRGFTLIELMAVFVIIGVMSAVFTKKVFLVESKADLTAITAGISELNSREMLTWFKVQMARDYSGDLDIFNQVDCTLGDRYTWASVTQDGGILRFGRASLALSREHSTRDQAGRWSAL